MKRRPPNTILTYPLFPFTTLFRSVACDPRLGAHLALQAPLRDSRSPAGGPGDDRGDHVLAGARQRRPAAAAGAGGAGSLAARARRHRAAALHRHHGLTEQDRKSVVYGKSVSVRVDLGGRRIFKKNKKTQQKKSLQIT